MARSPQDPLRSYKSIFLTNHDVKLRIKVEESATEKSSSFFFLLWASTASEPSMWSVCRFFRNELWTFWVLVKPWFFFAFFLHEFFIFPKITFQTALRAQSTLVNFIKLDKNCPMPRVQVAKFVKFTISQFCVFSAMLIFWCLNIYNSSQNGIASLWVFQKVLPNYQNTDYNNFFTG